MTCAVAAALVEMAAGFDDALDSGDIGARAGVLRRRALELADADLESYRPVLEALRLPAENRHRPEAVAAALSGAASTPFEIARAAAEVATLAGQVAARSSRHLIGDAATGAVLAQAACQAATLLVELNLGTSGDDRPRQAAQFVSDAGAACRQALSKAHES